MIRVDKLRAWVSARIGELRPALAALLVWIRALLAVIVRTARAAARDAREHLRPVATALEPRLRQGGESLFRSIERASDRALPVATASVNAVRQQVEAGRDTRSTRRELRDNRGRRLRASAYLFGPEGPRSVRRRARGGMPHVAGSLLPAGVKIGLVLVVALVAFLGSSSAYINYAAELPDAHVITEQPLAEDSLVFASDGTLLADLHPTNAAQHYYEPLDQMGRWLPQATIAIEDSSFWTEPGIDVFAMGRAAWIDWRQKEPVQGASTITQQLVKLRLLGNQPTFDRKVKEAVLALQVERTYSKRQILEQYLNAVDYSNNAKGSLAGARVYFHKNTRDLDLAQAAMLAGIPQSPLYNNPFSYWEQARKRQLQVLQAMVRNKMITPEQLDEAYAEDLSPPAHMYRQGRQVLAAPSFVSWIEDVLTAKYGEKATFGGGLRVYTTLNLPLQQLAERTVTENVNNNRGKFRISQGAMTAIDPRSGAVLAMVGSADPSANGGQYNMAVWPPRNPGSSMKIFNYTAAIESGKYAMSTMIPDTPLSFDRRWGVPAGWPKNYDQRTHGTCQLQQCMGNSLNLPAVKVELSIGVDRVVDMARRMGAPPWYPHIQSDFSVTYTGDDQPSTFGPSLTLGGYGETPLQMAAGASVLAAQGMYRPAYGITAIQTSDNTEIFRADPVKAAKQVLDPKVAYIMEQIMSNDDNRAMIFGHNSPLTLSGRRVAAKTGTTDDFTDAWTVGYTPSLAAAFWFGNPDYSRLVQGSDGVFVAAPAWHAFMQAALDLMKAPAAEWFSEPAGLGHATVGGEPVWLLPGTSANQPMPPLPPGVSSSGAPAPSASPPTSPTSSPPRDGKPKPNG